MTRDGSVVGALLLRRAGRRRGPFSTFGREREREIRGRAFLHGNREINCRFEVNGLKSTGDVPSGSPLLTTPKKKKKKD